MKKFFAEFKAFAIKGNMLDLAVAVVVGAAFNAIVTSLVNDIITPLIGILIGGYDFAGLSVQVGEASVMYGSLIQTVINFLITAFTLFLVVRAFNHIKDKAEAKKKAEEEAAKAAAEPEEEKKPDDIVLLEEIRDALIALKK